MLLAFVALYMFGTLALGWWASRRVKNTADFVVAGRKLPMAVAGAALFATWFGSETIMGAPAEFVEGGLLGVMEDPFGAALCLMLAGVFIAKPLYKLNILTFNDYYKLRFGRKAEFLTALCMVPSYLGWIAAQLIAIAIVLNVLLQDTLGIDFPIFWGIQLCAVLVVFYTYIGGMWAVSITDFVQTIMIIIGVIAMAVLVGVEAGGIKTVVAAQPEGFFQFFPERTFDGWVHYLAAWMTIGLGSIPQQDVFQRVMSAKSERAAVNAGYFGGILYLTVGFIPLFIGLCAKMLHPELLEGGVDPQKLLPLMCLKYGGLLVQILFFGAIISAILSTASGALLAPATVMGENLIKPFFKNMSDQRLLRTMRLSVLFIAAISVYIACTGESIYELVGLSSSLSLVSLFVPLVGGLYWKRASELGAIYALVFGMAGWIFAEFYLPETGYPSLIWGLLASVLGMVLGSLIRAKW